jgi:hypothetical protein
VSVMMMISYSTQGSTFRMSRAGTGFFFLHEMVVNCCLLPSAAAVIRVA